MYTAPLRLCETSRFFIPIPTFIQHCYTLNKTTASLRLSETSRFFIPAPINFYPILLHSKQNNRDLAALREKLVNGHNATPFFYHKNKQLRLCVLVQNNQPKEYSFCN
jgi:hypothetical protein